MFFSGIVPEDVEKIAAEGQKGPTAAAVLFIKIIVECNTDGWFQGLLDALRESGLLDVVGVLS